MQVYEGKKDITELKEKVGEWRRSLEKLKSKQYKCNSKTYNTALHVVDRIEKFYGHH